MLEKITGIIKDAVELNLRYSSTLLYLSKDYLKNFNTIITHSGQPRTQADNRSEPERPPKAPPLLIVGQLNETPGAAFALNNGSGKDVNVNLLIQGELSEKHVKVEPPVLALKAGESTIVRVQVHIDAALEVNRDYVGAVVAPGLSTQSVEFIVRRLPGETAQTRTKPTKDAAAKPTG